MELDLLDALSMPLEELEMLSGISRAQAEKSISDSGTKATVVENKKRVGKTLEYKPFGGNFSINVDEIFLELDKRDCPKVWSHGIVETSDLFYLDPGFRNDVLMECARLGLVECVEYLIQYPFDMSLKNFSGMTILDILDHQLKEPSGHFQKSRVEMCKDIIEEKLEKIPTLQFILKKVQASMVVPAVTMISEIESSQDINHKDRYEKTLLHHYAGTGFSYEHILDLILKYGANTEVTDDNGDTPLMIAASNGNAKAALMLLKAGADHTVGGETGIIYWAKTYLRNGIEDFREVIEFIIEKEKKNRQFSDLISILRLKYDDTSSIKKIIDGIESTGDISYKNQDGINILMAVCEHIDYEFAKKILGYGIGLFEQCKALDSTQKDLATFIELQDDGSTGLEEPIADLKNIILLIKAEMIKKGDYCFLFEELEKLKNKFDDKYFKDFIENVIKKKNIFEVDDWGRNLVTWTAFYRHPDLLKLLLAAGIPYKTNKEGLATPLMILEINWVETVPGYDETRKTLLSFIENMQIDIPKDDAGIIKNKNDSLPLIYDLLEGNNGGWKELISSTSDIDAIMIDPELEFYEGGASLLMVSAKTHDLRLIKPLLAFGANPMKKNPRGIDAFGFAKCLGGKLYSDVYNLLISSPLCKSADLQKLYDELDLRMMSDWKNSIESGNIDVTDAFGKSIVHEAVQRADLDLLRTVLLYGPDLNSIEYKGLTPYRYALKRFEETMDPVFFEAADTIRSASGFDEVFNI